MYGERAQVPQGSLLKELLKYRIKNIQIISDQLKDLIQKDKFLKRRI